MSKFKPEDQMRSYGWIYHYGCGCSVGPLPKSELLDYCGIHGHDLLDKYYISRRNRRHTGREKRRGL